MESAVEYWTSKALLDWQVEMGADEAIGDTPIDRYTLETKKPAPKVAAKPAAPPPAEVEVDTVALATSAANAAQDLDGLRGALGAFEHCTLKAAARNMVFSDGVAGAPVMFITDAPDRNEDRAGAMFAGQSGILFDKMLAAIGMGRSGDNPVYCTPVLPWNPPQNREPNAAEIAMMLPFLERHIALAAPKIVVLMGNGPCQALLKKSGMTRLRGRWVETASRPALPMFAPSYLLSHAPAKRDAWADLLALKARLKELE
ncbi:uracil-DNA glycosylase [Octadecabacter sp. 1_MG-2023]|uniref:uracil-DNA glycosylase n=1 Tax=unclassified Octadecabacter TaxID=196158 RepID=UPI001C09E27C|nr:MULTISPECIES: uracil-DNA glycosylase [unclassified Octadecabacter]MBU2994167.1 uracil-DNA glycosylase [Octadecabacter sp. B2R22]MDO6734544.1 uracil-DNA glycosylase [Octadecabacter sp. 1_MG-2023]